MVESTITKMSVDIEKSIAITGEKMRKPTFTLSNGKRPELTLSNIETNKATINTEAKKNQINLTNTTAKSLTINGNDGKEIIKIKNKSQLTGNTKINLGKNKDSILIDGIINMLTIDNGKDNSKDQIVITGDSLLRKKLKLKNFGREDRLIIAGDTLRYQTLKDKDIQNPLKELGIIVNLMDNN